MLGKLSIFIVVFAIFAANIFDIGIENSEDIWKQYCNYTMADSYNQQKSEFTKKGMQAFVLGGTGEVGKELVKALLQEGVFSKLVLIGRRQITYEDDLYKNVEQRVIDFDHLENHAEDFKGFDVGYSCLGTTRGKAGAEGFYKVDHDYVVNTAKLARDGGCKQFHLVSSGGANKNSMFLYPQTKGQVEEELKDMKFDKLFIYQPGLLLCDREESRGAEKAAKILMKPITYMFPTAMSVPTSTVAMSMINKTITSGSGSEPVEMVYNKEIHKAAKCSE